MIRIGALSIAIALFLCGAAVATPPGQSAMQNWGKMDDCARKAQAAFPDYTAELNAKRDAKLKDCLETGNLPPRAPMPSR